MNWMLKYNFLILVFVSGIHCSWSSETDDDFFNANQKYREEHYKTAAKMYQELIDSLGHNAEVYYNLGNAYFKSDQLGLAIWAYKMALKIDPRNEDAQFNLEFASLQIENRVDLPEPALTEWLKRLLFGPHINFWSYASILSGFLFSACVLFFVVVRSRRLKNLSMMGGMILALAFVFSIVVAWQHKKQIESVHEAVIIVKEADIKLSPIDKAKNAFTLSEGVVVTILKEQESWIEIDVNGNSGWVLEEDIKKI